MHVFEERIRYTPAVRQVRLDGGEKTFIFHPLFASEHFAEDKAGPAKNRQTYIVRSRFDGMFETKWCLHLFVLIDLVWPVFQELRLIRIKKQQG